MSSIGLATGASRIAQRASTYTQTFQNKNHLLCEGSRGLYYFDENKSSKELTRMTTVMDNLLGSASHWDTDYDKDVIEGRLHNVANQDRTVMMSQHGITVHMSAMSVRSMPDDLAFGSKSESISAMDLCKEATLSSAICTPKTLRKQVPPSPVANGPSERFQGPRYYKTKLCKYSVIGGCPRGTRFGF